jgi:hypothetical protein
MSCEIALGLFQEREKASMVFWTYTSKTDEKRLLKKETELSDMCLK